MTLSPTRASTEETATTLSDHGRREIARLDTGQMFGTAREVILVPRGQEYRLRITKAGKLILTK